MTSDEAILLWRVHHDKQDVFAMNDMDSQTGAIKPSSVVHVSRHQLDAKVNYVCTCQIYRHVKSTTSNEENGVTDETEGISFRVTCTHCRFLLEQVEEHIEHMIGNKP